MECKHFKRGKLFEDNTCSRICKDEIVLVNKLGETTGQSLLLLAKNGLNKSQVFPLFPSAFNLSKIAIFIRICLVHLRISKMGDMLSVREHSHPQEEPNTNPETPTLFPQQDLKLQTPSTALTRTRTTACSVFSTTRKPAANLFCMSSKNQVREANARSVLLSS